MGPIAPISGPRGIPGLGATTRAVKTATFEDPLSGVPPFWRQLHQRVSSLAGDQQKFQMLAGLALQSRHLPPVGQYMPPEIPFNLHEDDMREWARGQPPGVRGRLYKLLLGLNVTTPWPYYLLQNEGRFDARWQHGMSGAARRYVRALRADREAVALLRGDLESMPRKRREFLVERMTAHACAALDIEPAVARALDQAREDEQEAETKFETPVKIHFYPGAFRGGRINLIVTVFHEAIHAAQMHTIREVRKAEEGAPTPLDAEECGRGAMLDLSMRHLNAIDGQRRGDHHYYLYRYATEAEREAHVAELEVAILASECSEFNPAGDGTLCRINALRKQGGTSPCDPNRAVMDYVMQEAGLDAGRLGEAAARAQTAGDYTGPTLMTLTARKVRRGLPAMACRRAIARDCFDDTMHRLAARSGLLRREERRDVRREVRREMPPAPFECADEVWAGLLRLEHLRDPIDTAHMLSHALLSGAPKLFYGAGDETQFLRSVVIAALDARRPTLLAMVREHLLRRFGGRRGRAEARPSAAEMAEMLQRAWFAYRSDLARKIVFEVAAEVYGCAVAAGEPTAPGRKARRAALRRALAKGALPGFK
jgi:hypothetical protein